MQKPYGFWGDRIIDAERPEDIVSGKAFLPDGCDLSVSRDLFSTRKEEWADHWRQAGFENGLIIGFREGVQQGLALGEDEGQTEGGAALLLHQLERRFGLDENARHRIRSADTETLLRWAEQMLTASKLEDVFDG